MTDDAKPINGHDPSAAPTEDQPEPERTELDVANERVGKMMQTIMQHVAQTGAFNPPAVVADGVLYSQQLRTFCELLFEQKDDRPALLDSVAFNRRLGELCEQVTANLLKPKIAIAVGSALRPKQQPWRR